MATRFSRRLYSRRGTRRSSRAYSFPRARSYSYRSRGRSYRGYGSYIGLAARAVAPYALRAIPYIYRGYKAYQKGGTAGFKRYAGRLATSAARSAIKTVTGYGAYHGVGYGGMTGTQAPNIRNGSLDGGTIIISHKEFLGNVVTSDTPGVFQVSTYRINPGDEETFPWLSQLARNFQQYRLRGLCFHFKSMSGDAITGTNTALGSVIMSTNYDATQPNPTTKTELENLEFAQSIKPSKNLTHFIECAKSQSPMSQLYINENPANQEGDVRFYDFGKFHLATDGMQGTKVVIGELWVSYEIALYKPQLWDALGRDVGFFQWRTAAGTQSVNNTNPLGIVDWINVPDNMKYSFPVTNNLKVVNKTGNRVLFAPTGVPKCFIIQFWVTAGTSTFNIMANWTGINNTSCFQIYGDVTGSPIQFLEAPADDQACTRRAETIVARIDQENAQYNWGFQWTSPPGWPSITSINMTIIEIPFINTAMENRV